MLATGAGSRQQAHTLCGEYQAKEQVVLGVWRIVGCVVERGCGVALSLVVWLVAVVVSWCQSVVAWLRLQWSEVVVSVVVVEV